MIINFSQTEHDRFSDIFDTANRLGFEANQKFSPQPMIVGESKNLFSDEIDYNKPTYFVEDGVCGFASVIIKPANNRFAKWLVQTGKAYKSDMGGIYIWIHQYNQSMQRKEIHADAMAVYFKNMFPELKQCYVQSRMD